MALEEKRYVREVLIILDHEKNVVATHQVSITSIFRDGEHVTDMPAEGAVAVQPETLASALPDTATLYAQVMQLTLEVAAKSETIDALTRENEALIARVAEFAGGA